jgi:hypothetical protein
MLCWAYKCLITARVVSPTHHAVSDGHVDGEVRIHEAHLVEEALGHALNEVLDVRADLWRVKEARGRMGWGWAMGLGVAWRGVRLRKQGRERPGLTEPAWVRNQLRQRDETMSSAPLTVRMVASCLRLPNQRSTLNRLGGTPLSLLPPTSSSARFTCLKLRLSSPLGPFTVTSLDLIVMVTAFHTHKTSGTSGCLRLQPNPGAPNTSPGGASVSVYLDFILTVRRKSPSYNDSRKVMERCDPHASFYGLGEEARRTSAMRDLPPSGMLTYLVARISFMITWPTCRHEGGRERSHRTPPIHRWQKGQGATCGQMHQTPDDDPFMCTKAPDPPAPVIPNPRRIIMHPAFP